MADVSNATSSGRSKTLYQAGGVYRGLGSVFSERLNGTIEGTFEIEWDDLGTCRIRCFPSNMHPFAAILIAQDFDQFRDLQMKSQEGVFYARKCFLDKASMNMGESGNGSELTFVTLGAVFTESSEVHPVFWNAPILNFLMDLRGTTERSTHPLQISSMFCQTDQDQRQDDQGGTRRRIISFPFAGAPAFLEHVPNYETVKRQLLERTSPVLVTSVMAGSIPGSADLTIDGVTGWFPTDAILALTLATGTQVSLGFIELRDGCGQLCQRLHLSFVNGPYRDAHMTISDPIHNDRSASGAGALITAYLSTSETKLQIVRMLTETIETAQSALQTPDHAFAFIVRGLDGLANSLQLTRTILSKELPEQEAREVKAVLKSARNGIYGISRGLNALPDTKTANVLRRIASRAEQADSTEDSFGLSMTRVLEYFDLHDQEAIDSFYMQLPRSDGLTWNQALDKYRGGVIHRGFLDYSTGVLMDDVVCYTRHLVDIAIRICLKEVGYQGTYNPFNKTAMQRNEVGWVVDDKSIAQFGFSGRTPKLFRTIGFE
jgi:hypothetical protein